MNMEIFNNRKVSLKAKGLLALILALPPEQKISWADLVDVVEDQNELGVAGRELKDYDCDIWQIRNLLNASCARVRAKTTLSFFFKDIEELLKEDNKSSSLNAHARGESGTPHYPDTPEEVVQAAAGRAYLMSLEEAANFITSYAVPGWTFKDGRKIINWPNLLDRWKIGQSRDQYLQAQTEHRRRRQGLPRATKMIS